MPRPHATAAILSIGDEIALGQTLDTNSAWLAAELLTRGVATTEHTTVDDDRARTAAAITRLAAANDLVIATGGLGPTADDLTRFALADALGEPELVRDGPMLAEIEKWFAGRNGGMPRANAVQADRPPSAVCLANPHGTAPGLRATVGGCDVYCLPGPPREMKPMFAAEVLPRLRPREGVVVRTRLLLTIGLGESAVADRLGDLMDRDRPARGLPLVGTTASRGVVTCRVRHESSDAAAADRAMDDAEEQIRTRLGEALVFQRRDLSNGDAAEIEHALQETLLAMLAERGQRLAVVESCTGGLLGASLTAVPGSSAAFAGGWLTYANALKTELVGVGPKLLAEHGAVSGEVAIEMAAGGLERARAADMSVAHAVGITGVAGPGESEAKPAGTVWIGLASQDYTAPGGRRVEARKFFFKGGRDAVREWACRASLAMLRLRLIGRDMPLLGEKERREHEPA